MMAVTVAVALLDPLSDSCCPSSALTAVVIREKGPLINTPETFFFILEVVLKKSTQAPCSTKFNGKLNLALVSVK